MWRQLFANILGCSIIYADIDPATLGSISAVPEYFSGIASPHDAYSHITTQPEADPDGLYNRYYRIWRDAYTAVKTVNGSLTELG